jgi:ATP-binding cassette subfamily B protein
MLILDEATSNVDSRTEIQIQEAMNALMENRTCFIIAHRLSTIQNADTILVVQAGTIIEQGSHEELLKQGGFYSTLYNSQFS